MPTNNENLITVTGSVTHDESDGLQVSPTPATATEDNNDQDVANLSALQTNALALYNRLFTAGGLNLTPPASVNGGGQATAQVITVNNGAGLNDLKFTDALGNALNGLPSGLSTVNGDAISLYTDTNNNIVLGKLGNGDVAFALVLDELKNASNVVTGAKIWIVQFTPLDHGADASHDNALDLSGKLFVTGNQELLFGNFDDAPANQNAWTAVDNDATATTDIQLLITGQNVIQQGAANESYGDSVNTRATSLGSNNQAVNPGEALRFDTVTGMVVPIGAKEADFTQSIQYGDHVEVNGLGVTLVQTTPSAAVQVVEVSIFDVLADTAQGNAYVGGLDTSATGDANNDRVNIASVEIRNAANQTVEWRAVDGTLLGGTNVAAIAFTFGQSTDGVNAATNKATVTGLTVGMQIIVRSADGEVFDRLLVKNVGANAFDLGGIRILDASGDTDDVGAQVRFEDDGPTVDLSLNGTPALTVDETTLLAPASDGGTSLATTEDFGSDGDGGKVFSLQDPNGANSGLVDVASGAAVLLDRDGSDVVGFVDGGGAANAFDDPADTEVLRISIDSITGELTLLQSRAIVHPDENDADDIKGLAAGSVFANVRLTDGDGDTASDSLDISSIFKIKDDGPNATVSVNATPQLQTDDTTLASDDTETDPYATSPNDDGGADGQQSTVLAYSLVDVAAGTATGLFATIDGGAIVLDKVGDDLVGYVNHAGGAAFDNAADLEVFRVSIDPDTGQVTLDQKVAIKHDDGAEDNNDVQESNDATDGDPDTVLQQLSGPYIQVVATITDGDGDSFTTPPNFASLTINFLDDGPTAPTLTPSVTANVTHDESEAVQADTDVAGNTDTGGATIASRFAGLGAQAGDPDVGVKDTGGAIGFARSGANVALVDKTGGAFGADGPAGSGTTYVLGTAGGFSGAQTTNGSNIDVFAENGLVVGRVGGAGGTIAFAVAINPTTGEVYIAQYLSLRHSDTTQADESVLEPNDVVGLAAAAVQVTVTYTDGDNDQAASSPASVGSLIRFQDAGPTVTAVANAAGAATHDETPGIQANTDIDGATIAYGATPIASLFAGVPSPGEDTDVSGTGAIGYARGAGSALTAPGGAAGADGPAGTPLTYALSVTNGTDSLLDTTAGVNIFLFNGTGAAAGLVLGRVGNDAGTAATGATAFAIGTDPSTGQLFTVQYLSLTHPSTASNDEEISLAAGTLFMSVTRTDGDGDTATDTNNDISLQARFQDDGPTITAPFDADPGTAGIQTPEHLGNAVGQTASGTFGYDLGADGQAGGSDFIDANPSLANVQIGLTGTVDNPQNPGITNAVATRSAESATSASFDFSFHYDKDPITAGVQDATAGGTLVFDKVNDTYTFTLNDVIDGFSFDVLHTNELLRKEPVGNTGHPQIVVTELDEDLPGAPADGFYVQFTANTLSQPVPAFGFNGTGDGAPVAGDTTYNNGQFVTNINEDWVSATQDTNGVAGDTIQKGELLTLRFFKENILGDVPSTEKVDPTTSASGIVIKFDGIGASEDLVLVLDLKDANGNETTRAVNVQNSDLIKGNANVPAPYNTEFTLDNNDGLLIIEANDYNAAGETYAIQSVQIMQSANGLTGNAINLNGAIGAGGASNATGALTVWDPADQDVLKIVDIGFVQNTSGTLNSDLDFAFTLSDGDNDLTAFQHLLVSIRNDYIV